MVSAKIISFHVLRKNHVDKVRSAADHRMETAVVRPQSAIPGGIARRDLGNAAIRISDHDWQSGPTRGCSRLEPQVITIHHTKHLPVRPLRRR
jgi:hypothetical protein